MLQNQVTRGESAFSTATAALAAAVLLAAMVASRVVDNQVARTRPLCSYPQVARYSGQGSIDDAANFRCVAP